jgi:glycosyltransferase involved in cell wall biosynthesis
MPSVSVIIPFFNTPPRFLAETIESVLAQSYDDWELFLVDDGSTNESTDLARHAAATRPGQVRYLTHPARANRGASPSRNVALQHARGQYIALLDADDVWAEQKLEQQIALMAAHAGAAMLYGNTLYWYSWTGDPADAGRDAMPALGVPINQLIPPPRLLPQYLRGSASVPCTCSPLVRRAAVEAVGGFEETLFNNPYDDQAFWAKICLAFPVLVSETCWDLYRQHQASMSRAADRAGRNEEYRRRYLAWLEGYLCQRGIEDDAVWAALREEQRLLDDPAPLRWRRRSETVRRRARKLRSRMLGWLGREAEP